MKKYFLSGFLMTIATCVFSQHTDSVTVKSIVDETMRNGTAYENLRYLCKKIGSRLSGSANAQKAVDATFKMLQTAGADTVYLQPCMVPHWVRGEEESRYIESGNEKFDLHLCSLGNAVATPAEGVKAAVIEITSFNQLHSLGRAGIQGKIVFYNFPMNPTYIRTFQAYRESGISRSIGPAQAAKYGAVGVMVRSLASNPDDYPHTGFTQYNDSFPKIGAVAISTNDADRISGLLRQGKSLEAYFHTSCKVLPDAASFNVIGEIRGSERGSEILTVGGHLDSWDLAEGAQDDGAGCVQSIEIIRTLKALHLKPRRTIRAVMFMNEENGSGGADAYLAAAKRNKEKHLFALESDAGGFTPRAFSLEMKEANRDKIIRWKPLFEPYGITDIKEGGSGSDIRPLKELGVALAGFEPDSQRYFDLHHAASDVFESVSRRELLLGAANMAALMWLVSEYGL